MGECARLAGYNSRGTVIVLNRYGSLNIADGFTGGSPDLVAISQLRRLSSHPAEAFVNAIFKTTEPAVPVEGIGATHVILRCFWCFTFSIGLFRHPGNP